jgi:predicted  nucleic acid-binding Zn-ribbon protein
MDNLDFLNEQLKEYIQISTENRAQGRFNSIAIEVINTTIDKFNKDFKNIENSFLTLNKQNKIFHDEIKKNKNLLDILSKERVKNQQFNNRVNDKIVNIQVRIEELESNKITSPKNNDDSIDKINNKLNVHSQKLKELDKLVDNRELIESFKKKISETFEKQFNDLKKDFQIQLNNHKQSKNNEIDKLTMKNNELITEFRRLSNDFENMRCLSCKNKDTLQKEISKIDKNIGTFKKDIEDKVKKMRYNVESYNEDISNLKQTLISVSNKSTQENIDLDKLKERISNNEQQIIHHMNILQQTEQHITYQGGVLSQLCSTN